MNGSIRRVTRLRRQTNRWRRRQVFIYRTTTCSSLRSCQTVKNVLDGHANIVAQTIEVQVVSVIAERSLDMFRSGFKSQRKAGGNRGEWYEFVHAHTHRFPETRGLPRRSLAARHCRHIRLQPAAEFTVHLSNQIRRNMTGMVGAGYKSLE